MISFVLLAGTGMFVQFLLSAQHHDPGFPVEGVALLETDMRYAGYVGDQSQPAYEQLRQRIAAIPGVERAVLQLNLSNASHRPDRHRARQGISRLLSEFRGASRGEAGTGLFVQFLISAQHQEPGFTVRGVALLATDMRYGGYEGAQSQAAYNGFDNASRGCLVSSEPSCSEALQRRSSARRDRRTRHRPPQNSAEPLASGLWWLWAGPGYFDALRIPVLRGRVFDERDRLDTPRVAVISADTAVRYFGSLDAVGRRFRLENEPSSSSWFEVIGVVKQTTPDVVDGTRPLFYRSYLQADRPPTTVLARTSLDATALVGAMQRELRAMDPRLPVISALTLEQHMEDALFFSKTMSVFLGALGILGLTLAGIGLYAVVAFAVSQRSREVGIRMALGARSSQVTWLIAREVASVMGVAVALGAGLSVAVGLALARLDASAPNIELRVAIAEPASLAADHGADDAGGVGRDLLPRPSSGEGRPGLGAATHLARMIQE